MQPDEHGDLYPRPDPTKLTTAALDREVARIEKRLDREFAELHQLHDEAVRNTTQLVDQTATREVFRVEQRTDTALDNLKEWHESDVNGLREIFEERFKTIELRFSLIEQRRLELKEDSQKALDSALDSARESVANLADTYATGHTVLTLALDEVKTRLTTVEAKALGSKETSTVTLTMIGLGLTFLYLTVNVVVALVFHH